MIILRPVEDDSAAFERIRILGIGEIAFAEFLRDHAGLHDRRIEQIPAQHFESRRRFQRPIVGADDLGIVDLGAGDVFCNRFAVDRACFAVQSPGRVQFAHHRRQSAGTIIILTQIFAGRLHINEKRHVVADLLPIRGRKLDAGMARNGVDVDRRIG